MGYCYNRAQTILRQAMEGSMILAERTMNSTLLTCVFVAFGLL